METSQAGGVQPGLLHGPATEITLLGSGTLWWQKESFGCSACCCITGFHLITSSKIKLSSEWAEENFLLFSQNIHGNVCVLVSHNSLAWLFPCQAEGQSRSWSIDNNHDDINLLHARRTANMAVLELVRMNRDFLLFSERCLLLWAAGAFGSFLLKVLNLIVKWASKTEAKGKSHRFPIAYFKLEQNQ